MLCFNRSRGSKLPPLGGCWRRTIKTNAGCSQCSRSARSGRGFFRGRRAGNVTCRRRPIRFNLGYDYWCGLLTQCDSLPRQKHIRLRVTMPKQRPPFRVLVFISILAVGLITADRPATAGTGGGMQIPNLPTGKFNQPGAPGLCQCISDIRSVRLSCLSMAAECQSSCGTASYSFIPDAGQSCRGSVPIIASARTPMSPVR